MKCCAMYLHAACIILLADYFVIDGLWSECLSSSEGSQRSNLTYQEVNLTFFN